ncbi:MAG: hypothetical protein RL562_1200 [Planctomycetota bacterium]|jgi:hypothetical protein
MTRAILCCALPALLSAVPTLAQEVEPKPVEASQVRTIEDLLGFVKGRESKAGAVLMEIESVGKFPDGSEFRTEGTLRVLGKTHFHARMIAHLGPDVEAETETVRTPEGLWMRERDPVQREVFLAMDRATMERVDAATAVLGESAALGGFGTREAESPLGSLVLADLAQQFELQVGEPRDVGGTRCWIVGGAIKGGVDPDEEAFGLGADQVDVVVRIRDGALIKMTQFRGGEPLLEVSIPKLEILEELDPASFTLALPERAQWSSVLDHPPARAQLDQLFEDARAKGWKDPAAGTGSGDKDGGDR